MSKFTPGPWRVSADGINVGPEDAFAPFDGCGCCGSPWMSAKDGLADARLIAAAPDLYEALQAALSELERAATAEKRANSASTGLPKRDEAMRRLEAARAALAIEAARAALAKVDA